MTQKNHILISKNVNLKNFNTFHIGGKAKYLIQANSAEDLIDACKFCQSLNIKFKVIGFGSNLLFDDKGYNGAIIVNRSNKLRFYKNHCFVDSGVSISEVIKRALQKSLSGLEPLVGIPSTVGGGIANNVGAFSREISDLVEYVECYKISDLSKKIVLKKSDCDFVYRGSIFKQNNDYIITRVKLKFEKDDYLSISEHLNYYLYQKTTTQPIGKYSAGSIFKRSANMPISKVIDDLGLKGYSVGGASISTLHAGFIVANKNTKSSDVKSLINFIENKILDVYGIIAEKEIEYVDY